MYITKDMIIADVLMNNREIAPIFMAHGLHCLGCAAANMESIEDAARVHSINLQALLDDINASVKKD